MITNVLVQCNLYNIFVVIYDARVEMMRLFLQLFYSIDTSIGN